MAKTIQEINEKIKSGKAVILTAEEMIDYVEDNGVKAAAEKVDVVTTGTFGPMCSSGAYLNIGHTKPKMKLGGGPCYLNNVPVYTGWAAVDVYLGCTALPDHDPRNEEYPGRFEYGGGHVIEDLVAGKDLELIATGYGTDCYPRRDLKTYINIKDVNEAVLFNPRNAYQNYNVAVNLSDKTIHTYMGILKPDIANANYCSAGQLSPLLNDPLYKTIGIGTKIFLGGGVGYVAYWGTQHNPDAPRNDKGVPMSPAGTLALIGDLKNMDPRWLRGVSMSGYGVTLGVGIGIPIPILDEEMAVYTSVKDEDMTANIVDYSEDYPQGKGAPLGKVTYKELRSGKITINNKEVPTASLSSYYEAREIANSLKDWIERGEFSLTEKVESLPQPGDGYKVRPLKERPIK
jgi:uncharacterized protein (DUF39 family)